ncbi:hypothetical protein [Sulfurovum sp.]|uniref:hypothetical protein n=1 Tax=Sulfurovum sp. TaxID=1969726 RepID=UPI00286826A2|nr:hypothetical protein [Sulfurovum sp.]
MRYFIITFLVIILAIQGVLLMLFSATGNDLLLPHLNAHLKEDIKKYKVEVSGFRLGLNTLSFVAKVNDSVDVKAQGEVDLFDQTFDLDYTLEADEIKTQTITLKEDINIKGNVKGHEEDMKIRGKGLAFESQIAFDLRRVEDTLQDIKINMQKAEIGKILAVLNKNAYAEGLLTLEVDMPKFDANNPQGKAKIFIPRMTLNAEKISKDFDIHLPDKTLISADFLATSKEDLISLEGTLQSNLANLDISKGSYDPLTKKMDANYYLEVNDLSKFNALAKRELLGTLDIAGRVSQNKDVLQLSGSTKSFGGESDFVYKDDDLKLIFNNIKIETLLYKLGEKNYISGRTTANIHLSSVKKGTGTFDAQVKGNVNTKVVKEKTKTDLGETFYVNAQLKGDVKEKKIFSHIVLDTSMAKLKAERFVYDLEKRSLYSDYTMDIPDMRKLEPLTRKDFKGNMYMTGEIKKEKDLVITGQGKEFDGSVDFRLLNDNLKADIKGATVSKVMFMFGYPQVIEAISEAKADYNVKKRKGTVYGTLDNARILPSRLTAMLEQYAGMDLTHERFNNSKFVAKIDKKIIHFTLDATNKRNYIKVTKGFLDKSTDALRAHVDVEMEGKDISAIIQGTVDQPKISLNSSKYLEKKINKKLDTLIDKNIKGENAQQLKSLLKGFF